MDAQKQKVSRMQKEISQPKDFTDPEVLHNRLIKAVRQYHPSTDLSMIEKAWHLACKAHEGQKRKSGEPYIIHPLCVGIILAELELDKETIVAVIGDGALTGGLAFEALNNLAMFRKKKKNMISREQNTG